MAPLRPALLNLRILDATAYRGTVSYFGSHSSLLESWYLRIASVIFSQAHKVARFPLGTTDHPPRQPFMISSNDLHTQLRFQSR